MTAIASSPVPKPIPTAVANASKNMLMMFAGTKDSGKTTLLATGGKNMPETMAQLIELVKAGKTPDCSDVHIWQFDAGGDTGLKGLGLKPTVVDLSREINWKQAEKKLNALFADAQKRTDISVIGIDLTTLAEMIIEHYTALSPGNNMEIYGSGVKPALRKILTLARLTPCPVVFMTHLKVYDDSFKGGKSDKDAKEAHEARHELHAENIPYRFTWAVSGSIIGVIEPPLVARWVTRRENVRVNGAIKSRYWVDTDVTDFAPSSTKANSEYVKVVPPESTLTLKTMLAALNK